MAKDSVTMPMASAGIVGMSADTKLSGIEIDPKAYIIAVFVLVIIVNVGARLVSS
jgi:preprotein translocase subunit Sec61beta